MIISRSLLQRAKVLNLVIDLGISKHLFGFYSFLLSFKRQLQNTVHKNTLSAKKYASNTQTYTSDTHKSHLNTSIHVYIFCLFVLLPQQLSNCGQYYWINVVYNFHRKDLTCSHQAQFKHAV